MICRLYLYTNKYEPKEQIRTSCENYKTDRRFSNIFSIYDVDYSSEYGVAICHFLV